MQSSSCLIPDPVNARPFPSALTTMALGHSRRRWFGTCSCKPVPRGLPSSDKQLRATWPHGLSRSWRTMVGNPSVTRPNGLRRVREGLPVNHPELRSSKISQPPVFAECVGDFSTSEIGEELESTETSFFWEIKGKLEESHALSQIMQRQTPPLTLLVDNFVGLDGSVHNCRHAIRKWPNGNIDDN